MNECVCPHCGHELDEDELIEEGLLKETSKYIKCPDCNERFYVISTPTFSFEVTVTKENEEEEGEDNERD